MGSVINKVKYFLIPYLFSATICTIILILYSKSSIHLWINQHNSVSADAFFKYYTNVGDGFFVIGVALLLLLWKYGMALVVMTSYLISSLMAQIIKHFICPSALRPKAFFENTTSLHFIDGIKMYMTHSFPSGHSTSAFAMFLMLSFFVNNKWMQLFFLLLAVLVAYSRMYLSQHFLIDVLVGSVIGVLVSIGVYYSYNRNNKEWMERGLLKNI